MKKNKKFLKFYLLFLLIGSFTYAQSVTITEIAPHRIEDEDEWFEFVLRAEGLVDMKNWKVSNTKSTKTFSEKKDLLQVPQLYTGSGTSQVDEENDLLVDVSGEAILYWIKSPVSLANGGGTIQVLDEENNILDEISYPETKSGTLDGEAYAEIWNRKNSHEVFPLFYRKNDGSHRHSKGMKNFSEPVSSHDIELLISEISPDRESEKGTEFIELFVSSVLGDTANLRYLEIKHNGTPLISVDHDFEVREGDFIVLKLDGNPPSIVKKTNPHQISTNKRDGISAGSGTVEVILYAGTSWETTEDFACWKNGELSQIERERVDKNISADHWIGECIDIENMISNESIGRKTELPNTNTKNDFFRHFNGSEGLPNDTQNQAPIAHIQIQGGRKVFKGYINLTGDQSTDPDGENDIQLYEWRIDGKTCPDADDSWFWYKQCDEQFSKTNPDKIYFDAVGTYTISLTVTDFSGMSNTVSTEIEVTEHGVDPFGLRTSGSAGSSAFSESVQQWLKQESMDISTKNSSQKNQLLGEYDDFFDDFLMHQEMFSEDVSPTPTPLPDFLWNEPAPLPLKKRQMFNAEQKSRIAKNVGLIFVDS
jgi:hypothetical protein